MLEIKNFSKSYKGDKKAVDNLNLVVEDGDIFGFIGFNGAGKTTTIKCVVGILDFEEGDIMLDGISVRENSIEYKKRISYIPDNPDIYTYLTGEQYINFVAGIYGVEKEEREKTVYNYAQMFDMTEHLDELIESYSHGMRQKICIIAALVHKPSLLVLDEPFVGLDPKASHTLKTIMKDLCKQGTKIFFSTHVLPVAEKLCNKIGIIKEGKLIVSGDFEEIKRRYNKTNADDYSLEDLFLELDGSL